MLQGALSEAASRFAPQLVIFNAGTDVLEGDPLGRLNVSAAAVVRRDQLVFEFARSLRAPVLMLLSGGYQVCAFFSELLVLSAVVAHTICRRATLKSSQAAFKT
jgi:acetoin utilization deacetylase AcuC-like enzyme